MNPNAFQGHRTSAITLLEVMIVMALLAIVSGALLLPALAKSRAKACRISCVSNLKQIGLGVRMWAIDHEDRYPGHVPVTQGGSMDHPLYYRARVHFQVLSNELCTPRVLLCPSDTNRVAAWSFATNLLNCNISYFYGLDTMEERPSGILAGDRNLTIDGIRIRSGVFQGGPDDSLGWDEWIHNKHGNVALADGSVQQLSEQALREAWVHSGGTNRLVIP
jgi:prepilin-type processing-associated H-X9-DG protein